MKASICLLLVLCLFAGLSVIIQLQTYLHEKRKERKEKESLTKEDVEGVLRKVYHDKQHGKLRE